jgi:hypothetical protein
MLPHEETLGVGFTSGTPVSAADTGDGEKLVTKIKNERRKEAQFFFISKFYGL